MEREQFEELVAHAVDNLPAEFAAQLDNVAIVVEDYPSRAQLRQSNVNRDYTLLGLYEGVPHTRRGENYGMVLPDKITIFQKSIEASCKTDIQVVTMVRKVVLHEIAHHFGISDARLAELENNNE
jgi:predicted Zn-dependent protease with MMP-like domain